MKVCVSDKIWYDITRLSSVIHNLRSFGWSCLSLFCVTETACCNLVNLLCCFGSYMCVCSFTCVFENCWPTLTCIITCNNRPETCWFRHSCHQTNYSCATINDSICNSTRGFKVMEPRSKYTANSKLSPYQQTCPASVGAFNDCVIWSQQHRYIKVHQLCTTRSYVCASFVHFDCWCSADSGSKQKHLVIVDMLAIPLLCYTQSSHILYVGRKEGRLMMALST